MVTERIEKSSTMGYDRTRDDVMGRTKVKYLQEPLFEELKRDICYVCYGKIKKDEGIYIGNGMWRHGKCKPGGSTWLKSPVGRGSSLASYFETEKPR
jgi:hypothetical protein